MGIPPGGKAKGTSLRRCGKERTAFEPGPQCPKGCRHVALAWTEKAGVIAFLCIPWDHWRAAVGFNPPVTFEKSQVVAARSLPLFSRQHIPGNTFQALPPTRNYHRLACGKAQSGSPHNSTLSQNGGGQ